jgi:D-glycero-D-manno-heptose 1,7-bisphosphate phosphatase
VRAIFLDKDGTLVNDIPYNVDPSLLVLAPGAAAGLRLMARLGYALFVVSNQAGVAKGIFPESALPAVEQGLHRLLQRQGVALADFFYCPHHPAGTVARYAVDCDCRKPQPGMLLQAARRHGIDLAESWMIGDILDDIEAGHRAGCRSILIDNGNETEWLMSAARQPELTVANLYCAARAIEKSDSRRSIAGAAKAVHS